MKKKKIFELKNFNINFIFKLIIYIFFFFINFFQINNVKKLRRK